jgi:hypothetical protein
MGLKGAPVHFIRITDAMQLFSLPFADGLSFFWAGFTQLGTTPMTAAELQALWLAARLHRGGPLGLLTTGIRCRRPRPQPGDPRKQGRGRHQQPEGVGRHDLGYERSPDYCDPKRRRTGGASGLGSCWHPSPSLPSSSGDIELVPRLNSPLVAPRAPAPWRPPRASSRLRAAVRPRDRDALRRRMSAGSSGSSTTATACTPSGRPPILGLHQSRGKRDALIPAPRSQLRVQEGSSA